MFRFALVCALALSSAQAAPSAAYASEPLSIAAMRARAYPGSPLVVRQTLTPGSNYQRYVVSYLSDGLRVNALLTVPSGKSPAGGWPAIVFNHGYIPPNVYRTTQRYAAYQDAFARAGFVTLKSDYRGHGSSQGVAQGAYYAPDYTVDVLNALGSLKRDKRVNAARIGMWGHSMGGHLTLRAMVIDKSIKAGVIWAGVVAPYDFLQQHWQRGPGAEVIAPRLRRSGDALKAKYGSAQQNPAFWAAVSPNSFLKDISGPLQLHQGSADVEVPPSFHLELERELRAAGQPYTAYTYPGDNHNLSRNLTLALQRSVAFFKKYL